MMKLIINSKNISYRNIFCNYTCPFMSRLQVNVHCGASQYHISWPVLKTQVICSVAHCVSEIPEKDIPHFQ